MRPILIATLVVATGLLSACGTGKPFGPQMDVKMYGTARRPAELDRLSPFVGTWSSIAEQRDLASGRTTRVEQTSTVRWVAGDRFLMTETTRMRDAASESAVSITTWDPALQLYRQWTFDQSGTVVAGEDWSFNSEDSSWRLTRQAGDERIESILRMEPDGSRMSVKYTVWGRGAKGKIAEGSAMATRTR